MPGFFLSLDGVDGTGKSTQIERLSYWLQQQGCSVATCVDPGGTDLGQQLRSILLDVRSTIDHRAEALLFMASRAQLIHEIIRPNLANNRIVISDRFTLANIVYQGHASGLSIEELWSIAQFATSGIAPDLTIVLDLPIEISAKRMGRTLDRMEQRTLDWKERVRQGFLTEAAKDPAKYVVVDANGSPEDVEQRLHQLLLPKLQAHFIGGSGT
jgi:dTMP kinase